MIVSIRNWELCKKFVQGPFQSTTKAPDRRTVRYNEWSSWRHLILSIPQYKKKTQIASNSSAKVLIFHDRLQLQFYTVYVPHTSLLSPSSFFALSFNLISEAKCFFFVLKASFVIFLWVPCDSRRLALLFFFLCVSMLHICLPYLLFCEDSLVLPAFTFRIPCKIRTAVATRKNLELMTHYEICSSVFQIKC